MTLATRRPTGRPSWPILLLAGMQKAGKTHAAARASASEMIGDTYWLTVGEDDPDEYGALPGVRFQIVEQPGTYRSLADSIRAINALDDPAKLPSLIVLDSVSMLWRLLSDEAQQGANARQARKQKRSPDPGDEATITPELWNLAAKRWQRIMDLLRAHRGPVLLTARMSLVMEMDGEKPTGAKHWKIEGHKSLPYDVSGIIEMRALGDNYLTGVRSLRVVGGPIAHVKLPETVDIAEIWARLGMAEATARQGNSPDGAASVRADDEARDALLTRLRPVVSDWEKMRAFWERQYGEQIERATDIDALRDLVEQGERAAAERAATKPTEADAIHAAQDTLGAEIIEEPAA